MSGVRKLLEEQLLKSNTDTMFQMTISLGIAEFTEEIGSAKEWLILSDKALYHSKGAGRNQTTVF